MQKCRMIRFWLSTSRMSTRASPALSPAKSVRNTVNLLSSLQKATVIFLKGSGRSIEAYSMYNKMVEVKDLMLGFGGHPLAAGLSLTEENLEEFRKQLNARSGLTDADFIPKVMIDVILPVDFLTQSFIKQL